MEKTYEDIKNILNKIALRLSNEKSNSVWTSEIKKQLARLGEKSGFDICTSGFEDRYSGEWLYDLVWYKKNENKRLQSLELVVESEWKRELSEIQYDFEKRLISNAKHRLFICQTNPDKTKELEAYFHKALTDYNQLDQKFTVCVAILDDYISGKFNFKTYKDEK